ncbi:hypothetical protein N7509_000272 [Penicillium cosmopolitanum]|uniref:Uncharacterized protein n=2 Tax=Penicillium TaxID=5073 RepID=A0A9X0BE11_9EURO|nr:uncharacterized protein N7509_000272 [Penicillium cosmopolitanum]KAJ5413645.1 hypothetical protein N7509_000272 [Penicillium cosmopolitanum]
MQAHTLSQISSLGLIEDYEISDRNSDNIPISGQTPQPTIPLSIFNTSASNLSTQSSMEAYTHAMQTYTLSQISFLDLSEHHEISDRVSDDFPTKNVLYQGPGPNAVKTEEVAPQAVTGAEYSHA